MAGRMINGAAALAELIRPASDTDEIGVHRVLPVLPELSGLLPGRGLRRGSTVAVATGRAAPAGGGTSLLLALLAAASQSGSWCAVVGVPALGALAAAESGIALDRLALVPNPGPDWPTVVAALIDGVDLVVTAVPGPISSSIAGRLAARARQRGSVLMPFGSWAGADLTLQVTQGRWEGLGQGHGRLRRRRVTVLAQGRGAAARPRELTMWMPGLTTPPVPVPPRSAPGPPDPAHPRHRRASPRPSPPRPLARRLAASRRPRRCARQPVLRPSRSRSASPARRAPGRASVVGRVRPRWSCVRSCAGLRSARVRLSRRPCRSCLRRSCRAVPSASSRSRRPACASCGWSRRAFCVSLDLGGVSRSLECRRSLDWSCRILAVAPLGRSTRSLKRPLGRAEAPVSGTRVDQAGEGRVSGETGGRCGLVAA